MYIASAIAVTINFAHMHGRGNHAMGMQCACIHGYAMCILSWVCNVHAFMGMQCARFHGYAMCMLSWVCNVHAFMGMQCARFHGYAMCILS